MPNVSHKLPKKAVNMSQNSHKDYVVPSKSIARRLSIQLGREIKVGDVLARMEVAKR